jgi:RNA polymerase sigma-70 factor (ECF subfamily)
MIVRDPLPSVGDAAPAMTDRPDIPNERSGERPGARPRPRTPEEAEAHASVPAEVLVLEAQRGDRKSLERLLSMHADAIFATCLRMTGRPETARDLAQDAMVRLIESLDSYDGRAKFSTWMTRVVINLCITHQRRMKLRRHASLDAPMGEDGGPGWSVREQGREPNAEARVEQGEMIARLRIAMDRIEPDARAILVLRDVRGFDYAQIGEVLDVPVGTVKSRIFRARSALRQQMEALGQPTVPRPDAEGR